jgi:hypothetical protein
MKTLETLAAIVTGALTLIGLWTVCLAVRIEIAHRLRSKKRSQK